MGLFSIPPYAFSSFGITEPSSNIFYLDYVVCKGFSIKKIYIMVRHVELNIFLHDNSLLHPIIFFCVTIIDRQI